LRVTQLCPCSHRHPTVTVASQSRQHAPGSEEWFEAVVKARTENGEHLDEEEREAMPDFIKSASLDLRRELA